MRKHKHHVRVSADYLQTGEGFNAKRNRFASDALKADIFENESQQEQHKTSLMQDRSTQLLNASMRKKSSLVSINSSKYKGVSQDNGCEQPSTNIISGGNSHDFDRGLMAKMDPIMKVYDPSYSIAQNKSFTSKKGSKKQAEVKTDPSYNLQIKKTFKPIQISSRQNMS